MIEQNLENLRELYTKLPTNSEGIINEETIKISIVRNFFLMQGAEESWFDYEPFPDKSKEIKDRVDIAVKFNGIDSLEKTLYIEVKKGSKDLSSNFLTSKACKQLVRYIHSANLEWGILTDGNCYMLFNDSIKGSLEQKEVLRFYLFNPLNKSAKYRNESNLKYFDLKCLFRFQTTNYFKYLSEFKAYFKNENKTENSLKQYESTIYNFLDYTADKEKSFSLGYIDPNKFKQYLLDDISSKITNKSKKIPDTETTIKNKFAHISSFCDMLENKRDISVNPFRKFKSKGFKKEFISEDINIETDNEPKELLKESEIESILNSYNNTRESIRNKLIFLLFLYLGLDIQEIKLLKVNDIDLNKQAIHLANRTIPLHPSIFNLLKRYIEDRNSKKIKSEYLICRYYGNHYYHFEDSNFNKIISVKFNTLDIPDKRKKS
ncbi:tyrosine-type recombinase/integrase [Clostridium magnum]|uniref:Tyrosine recombinase XerC n=1 Tax=Clostridium magnum DSM 2767 TaxID=1121326 RepID=A0A161X4G9_9CLOT|nr:tyrosine-type recombinase/integrase [Clostridium magnum]KZL88786.1 tyrosine recombinase XerC [Clostridium magnum DSM 2767]